LLNAFYDDISRRIIMRVRSKELSAIYIVDRDTLDTTLVPNSSHDAVILAVNEGVLYYAAEHSSVYKYDTDTGTSIRLYDFDDPVSFERNADLSGFVIVNGNTAQIFNAKTGVLSEAADTDEVLDVFKSQTSGRITSELFKVFELTTRKCNNFDQIIIFSFHNRKRCL
jgi:hypothetical protein